MWCTATKQIAVAETGWGGRHGYKAKVVALDMVLEVGHRLGNTQLRAKIKQTDGGLGAIDILLEGPGSLHAG